MLNFCFSRMVQGNEIERTNPFAALPPHRENRTKPSRVSASPRIVLRLDKGHENYQTKPNYRRNPCTLQNRPSPASILRAHPGHHADKLSNLRRSSPREYAGGGSR